MTVLCHGCFDILHIGHIRHLEEAKKLGDRLIVSVTTDEFVEKGPGRPHFNIEERVRMLQELRLVDEVRVSHSATAIPIINELKPDVYVKGPDYKDASHDITGQIEAEKRAVESYGGRLVFTTAPTCSSSTLFNDYFSNRTPAQREAIDEINRLGGFGKLQEVIESLSALKVAVAGECIHDVYRYVEAQGISSKSPSLSTRFLWEEESRGGAWAIYAHLRDFCEVQLVSSGQWHEKIRYIAGTQRLFEVCDHPEEPPIETEITSDILIAADFGHGFFDRFPLPKVPFLTVNAQANSSNFGFHTLKKWESKWSYAVCDKRELALWDGDPGNTVAVTLGPNGSSYRGVNCPAFTDSVVDATGAGDAYFAITSLLAAVECDSLLNCFIGNVFAGLKTKIVGNKRAVTKVELLKALKGILA